MNPFISLRKGIYNTLKSREVMARNPQGAARGA